MQVRRLAIDGAFAFTPVTHRDHRGLFVSPHEQSPFESAVGSASFGVAQTSFSESRRGVVRGIHFSATPPGAAKYVCCVRGSALDVVVDTRVGSATFGRWDSTSLNHESYRAVYVPVGVGHMFIALEDDTVMSYLLSESYAAERERAVNPLDPSLGLPIPDDLEPVLSERDRNAPTLAQAQSANLLPHLADCRELEAATRAAAAGASGGAGSPD